MVVERSTSSLGPVRSKRKLTVLKLRSLKEGSRGAGWHWRWCTYLAGVEKAIPSGFSCIYRKELLLSGRRDTAGEMLIGRGSRQKEQMPSSSTRPSSAPYWQSLPCSSWQNRSLSKTKALEYRKVGFQIKGNNFSDIGGIHNNKNLLKCGTCELENEIKQTKVSNMGQISCLFKIKL